MRKLLAALFAAFLFLLPAPKVQAQQQTRTQLISNLPVCWPTNGHGLITAASVRACQTILIDSVSWIWGDITSLAKVGGAAVYNWNWPTTAGSAGQCLVSGGGGAATMTWGVCSGSSITIATNADVWAATANKIIDAQVAQTSLAEQGVGFSTPTYTVDMNAGINFSITLATSGGPFILNNPVNAKAGWSGVIRVTQPASGGPALINTYGNQWLIPNGRTLPTLSTAANAVDKFTFYCTDATHCYLDFAANYQ